MILSKLTKKHNIRITDSIKRLCDYGTELMINSKDPLHSDAHVFQMYAILDEFLQNEKMNNLDFDILLPSIAWHDVWQATQPQTTNTFKFIYQKMYEGFGSKKKFLKLVNNFPIDNKVTDDIAYCILHHAHPMTSRFGRRIYKPRLVEAKVLRDIDSLSYWSKERQDHLKKIYFNSDGTLKNPRLIILFRWLFNKSVKNLGNFYFEWSKKELKRRKGSLIKEAERLLKINEKK